MAERARPSSGGQGMCMAKMHRSVLGRAVGVILCLLATLPLSADQQPPVISAPPVLRLPHAVADTLPNGLRVVVVERPSLPLVTSRLVVCSGADADPPGLPGLAQLVADLLTAGTTRRNAQEVAEIIDSIGGVIDAEAAPDRSQVTLAVLKQDTDVAFQLLAEIILQPAFASAELERVRKQKLSTLAVLGQDPVHLADTVVRRLIFAGTSYGRPIDGTPASVGRITVADLREFHRRHYHASNAVLIVVGDITAAETRRLAERYFGGWPPGPASLAAISPANHHAKRKMVVIDRPDAVQSEIRVAMPAPPRPSSDYYALSVANQILGGPAANRLFRALRTEEALTYGADSELLCYRTAGAWIVKTATRTSATARGLELALEEIKRLRGRIISEPELEAAQGYLAGHLALQFETPQDVAGRFMELLLNDLPFDYWSGFAQSIRAVNKADVQRVTTDYVDPERTIIVLVGSAKDLASTIKRYGPSRIVPVSKLDLSKPDLE